MNDTNKEIENLYREMLMKLSPQERFLMGIRMFNTARRIVISSLPKNLTDGEIREALFTRFYKNDFSEEEFKKICETLNPKNT